MNTKWQRLLELVQKAPRRTLDGQVYLVRPDHSFVGGMCGMLGYMMWNNEITSIEYDFMDHVITLAVPENCSYMFPLTVEGHLKREQWIKDQIKCT